jgi:electron transport complex protein RnfC
MGLPLASDAVPVVKGTNCIVVASREEIRPRRPMLPCIRCGECSRICPAQLLPQQLYWHARAGELDRAQDYHLFDCIECGSCDVVCPSQIPLTQYFRYAKTEIWARERDRSRAEQARQRFEARRSRVDAEKEARRRRLDEKSKALEQTKDDAEARKAAVDEVLERVQARKHGDDPE